MAINFFDEAQYLADNPDVDAAVAAGVFSSGLEHWLAFGLDEGRSPTEADAFFDETFYLAQAGNTDVSVALAAGVFDSAFEHFVLFGADEERAPSAVIAAFFDETFYLANNPDVDAAVAAGDFASGYEHFVLFGADEGRDPSADFNSDDYLAANPDVDAAVTAGVFDSAFEHFFFFGESEDRDPLGPVPGETFVLTTGVDFIDGTAGDDLILGTDGTAADTLTAGDLIDGAGGTDTLRITITNDGDHHVRLLPVDLVSVENLEINVRGDDAFSFADLADNSFETVTFDFGGNEHFREIRVINVLPTSLIVIQNADGDGNSFRFDFTDLGESIDGSMKLENVDNFDAINVNFDDDSAADDRFFLELAGVSNTDNNMEFDIDGIENLDILVSADSTLGELDHFRQDAAGGLGVQTVNLQLDANLTIEDSWNFNNDNNASLIITGDGNLFVERLQDNDNQVKNIDATDATGNLNFNEIESDWETVLLGEGNDRANFESGAFTTDTTADGGDGVDILGVDPDDVDQIAGATVSDFETLELSGFANSSLATIDLDDPDFGGGFANLILSHDINKALTVEDLTGDLTISEHQSGNITITADPLFDLDILFKEPVSDPITIQSLDVSDFDAVNVTTDSKDVDVTFNFLDVDGVDVLSFSGAGDIDIDGLDNAGLDTLDLSGLTGAFDNDSFAFNNDVDVIIGNLGADSGGPDSSIIELDTGGSSTFTFGNTLDNNLRIDGFDDGVGGDVLNFAALGIDDINDLDIVTGGSGVRITAVGDEFDGQIELEGVNLADLDAAANFLFA